MRVLLITTFYTGYAIQLIKYVKKYFTDIQFSILTTSQAAKSYREKLACDDYECVYTSKNILVSLSMGKPISHLPYFDIIQALWMEIPWGIFAKKLKKKTKALYVEVGGSDLYRESKNPILYRLQKRLIKQADSISSESKETKELFYNTYGKWTRNIPHYTVRFGVDVIDEIGKLKEPIFDIKAKWKIPNDKIIVMCGHNGSPAHQHLAMIKAIGNIYEVLLRRCFFIFPMTYGTPDEKYANSIKNELEKITKNYVILRKYMTSTEMAEFARMTDVMVHVQTTDQLSSTMMAHLYDENIIIAGSWLPYQQIKDEGIRFWEVDEISELAEMLSDIASDTVKYKKACAGNRDRVYQFSSWEYCVKEWYNVYESMMTGLEDK